MSNDGNGYEKHSCTLLMIDATGSFVQLVHGLFQELHCFKQLLGLN